jgi:hypothetical protein
MCVGETEGRKHAGHDGFEGKRRWGQERGWVKTKHNRFHCSDTDGSQGIRLWPREGVGVGAQHVERLLRPCGVMCGPMRRRVSRDTGGGAGHAHGGVHDMMSMQQANARDKKVQ